MSEVMACLFGIILGMVLWHSIYGVYYRKYSETGNALIARLRELRDAKPIVKVDVTDSSDVRKFLAARAAAETRRDLAIELLAMLGEE